MSEVICAGFLPAMRSIAAFFFASFDILSIRAAIRLTHFLYLLAVYSALFFIPSFSFRRHSRARHSPPLGDNIEYSATAGSLGGGSVR